MKDEIAFVLIQMSDQISIRLRPYQIGLRLTVTEQENTDMAGFTRETAGIN